MSSVYLYGLTDCPEPALPELAGLDGWPVQALRCGELQAVVSPISGERVDLSRERLLRHEAVLEALMERWAVLPARFGTVAEAGVVAEALGRFQGLVAARLARVSGRVEVGLRVLWDAPAEPPATRPAPAGSGRAYMQALAARSQQGRDRRAEAAALAGALTAGLSELADEEEQEVLPSPKLLVKASYLLRRELVPELRSRVGALRAAHPGLGFLATGPWPPYSFTGIDQSRVPTYLEPLAGAPR